MAGGTGSLRPEMDAPGIDDKLGALNEKQHQAWFDKHQSAAGTTIIQDRATTPRKGKNILHDNDTSDDDTQPGGRIGDDSTQDGRSLSKFESSIRIADSRNERSKASTSNQGKSRN